MFLFKMEVLEQVIMKLKICGFSFKQLPCSFYFRLRFSGTGILVSYLEYFPNTLKLILWTLIKVLLI